MRLYPTSSYTFLPSLTKNTSEHMAEFINGEKLFERTIQYAKDLYYKTKPDIGVLLFKKNSTDKSVLEDFCKTTGIEIISNKYLENILDYLHRQDPEYEKKSGYVGKVIHYLQNYSFNGLQILKHRHKEVYLIIQGSYIEFDKIGLNPKNAIPQINDLEGYGIENIGKLVNGLPCTTPFIPDSILSLLKLNKIQIKEKSLAIVSENDILTKLLLLSYLDESCILTTVPTDIKNIDKYTKNADIVITDIKKPLFISKHMIKHGATIIDLQDEKTSGTHIQSIQLVADYIIQKSTIDKISTALMILSMVKGRKDNV